MKTVYQDENNFVLDENGFERKSCINRESKNLELTIWLYSCHNINMKFLVVVTPLSIYHNSCHGHIMKLNNKRNSFPEKILKT